MSQVKVENVDGLVLVEKQGEAPRMVFLGFQTPVTTGTDGIPEININVHGYVDMGCLSRELRDKIREELGINKSPNKCGRCGQAPFFCECTGLLSDKTE